MKIDKNLLMMLWVELSPLLCLKWFEPVGARLELLTGNISNQVSEGLIKEDISLLRKIRINVSNLPIEIRDFLSAIGSLIVSDRCVGSEMEAYKPAINALGWSVTLGYKISDHYQELILKLWGDIYGYDCPYEFT
jgi:hypothetical protein